MTLAEYRQAQQDIAEIKAQIAQLRTMLSQGASAIRDIYGLDQPKQEEPRPDTTARIMSPQEQAIMEAQIPEAVTQEELDRMTPEERLARLTAQSQEPSGVGAYLQPVPQATKPLQAEVPYPEEAEPSKTRAFVGSAVQALAPGAERKIDPAMMESIRASQAENPITSMIGGMAGSVPALAAGSGALSTVPKLAGTGLKMMGREAIVGAGYGAAEAAETGDLSAIPTNAALFPLMGAAGQVGGELISLAKARMKLKSIGKKPTEAMPTTAEEVVAKAAPEQPIPETVPKTPAIPKQETPPIQESPLSKAKKQRAGKISTEPVKAQDAGATPAQSTISEVTQKPITPETPPTPSAAISETPATKQPWEMTREEALNRANPSKHRIRDSEREPLSEQQMRGGRNPNFKPLYSESLKDGTKVQYTTNGARIDAEINGEPVGFIQPILGRGTDLTVATEWQRKGIGSRLQQLYREINPNAQSGGLTIGAEASFKRAHKLSVAQALSEGKPVPASVLADYPDLAAKYGKGAEPPKVAGTVTQKAEPQPVKAVEAVAPKVAEEPKSLGLNKEQIAEIRKTTGLDELPQADRDRHIAVLNRAKEGGIDNQAIDIASDVKNHPRPLTNEEHAGMVLRARDLYRERNETVQAISDAIESGADPKDLRARLRTLDDNLDLLTEASDLGGREAARSLSIRRMRIMMETDDIVHVRREAQTLKGGKLSNEEASRFEQLVAEKDAALKRLEEENARWQKDYDELQAKQAQALIDHEANRAKIKERIQGKREKIQAERADLLKQLRERGFETKLNAGLDPQDAYLIGKLGVNYIRGGINNLDEVVRLVMNDIPSLTRRDVLQSLNAKNPELQARGKAIAESKITQLKKQAELLLKIEDAEKGIFDKTKKPIVTASGEIKLLQKKLRELRLSSYQTIRDADRLERLQTTLNKAQDQLANHYRDIRKGKPTDPQNIAQLKQDLAEVRRLMKIEDELARLEDQVRTGDFEVPQDVVTRPKSEALERAEIDLRRARRVIRDEMEKLRPKSAGEKVLRVAENLRAIKATADLSATLRQGAISVVSHPIQAAKNFVPAMKATFSKYKAEQIDIAMRTPDKQFLRDKAKLELTNIDGTPTTREEHFAGVWIEKVPGFGQVVKASNRHMATFLNLMRTSMFDDFAQKFPNATTEELQAYARWINVTTGRGELGKFAQAGRALGTAFFAPRFAVSRIQTPFVFIKSMKSSPRVRAQVAKEAAAVGATAMGVLALAKLSGAEVGDDPRTSDFGKIRIGDERIDIFAGYQQPMRLIVRAGAYGTDYAGVTGKYLREEDKDYDPIDAVLQFAEFKLSPIITMPREWITGKSAVGEKVTITERAIRTVEPMLVNSIREAWKTEGLATAVRSGALNLLGVSSSVYDDSESRLRRDIAEANKKGDLEAVNRKNKELSELLRTKREKKSQELRDKLGMNKSQ